MRVDRLGAVNETRDAAVVRSASTECVSGSVLGAHVLAGLGVGGGKDIVAKHLTAVCGAALGSVTTHVNMKHGVQQISSLCHPRCVDPPKREQRSALLDTHPSL